MDSRWKRFICCFLEGKRIKEEGKVLQQAHKRDKLEFALDPSCTVMRTLLMREGPPWQFNMDLENKSVYPSP